MNGAKGAASAAPAAVLEAVARGESVIATNAGKKPWYSWKQYQSKAASAEQIEGWAKSDICTGFAVVTGEVSRLLILDFDDEDGIALCKKLALEPHVLTPSEGFHVRFVHPGFKVKTLNSETAKRLQQRWHGLDIRADGGYAVEWGRNGAGEYRTLRDLTELEPLDRLPGQLLADLGIAQNGAPEPATEPDRTAKVRHPGRHAHLLGVAGAMRGRGEAADAILAELRRVNERDCDPPKLDSELVALANDVGGRYKPDEHKLSFDDKGKLRLPPKPKQDDPAGQCAWLTVVLGLDPNHPVTGAHRHGGSGSGSVVLDRRDARSIHFNPYSRLTNPPRFRETLVGQLRDSDGEPPGLRNEHLFRLEHVVRQLAAGFKAEADEVLTGGILATALHEAELAPGEFTTYADSQARYLAVEALRPGGDFARVTHYLIDSATGEYVIRVSDLATAARRHTGNTMPGDLLDARMGEYGWERVELQGWECPDGRGGLGADTAAVTSIAATFTTTPTKRREHVNTGEHAPTREKRGFASRARINYYTRVHVFTGRVAAGGAPAGRLP